MESNLPAYAERLRDALAPRTPAEERTVDYLAAVTKLQAPELLGMLTRMVADAYDRGHADGIRYAREQQERGLSPELWDEGGGRP